MSAHQIVTIDPLTEEVIATREYMSDEKAADVVAASHEAFLDWRLRSLEDRAAPKGSRNSST
ncbi:hypothetical protein [Croceicoccus sp. BE223]|uniref:hypothetical protein n=1 Tax=Croceicoccus sp. BE223 TaxID=2817716 RepID=UPI0028585070|nr:hypothetical protein [Croceicoccus sp. BE223]MDR7102411.1 acyl-CoA reductase-like NAD-dependent aldehyde dehydrogenase [Croceicoccus sp. BE223]